MRRSLLLIGLGDLGGVILELLARDATFDRIIVASRNERRGVARCNLARLGALAQGLDPSITFVPLDLNNKEGVAEIVSRVAPDIIVSCATLQTWWLPDLLPPQQKSIINKAGFGVWLPVHLTLTLKLMEALREAAYRGLTITAPFPDVVNCILDRLDLAPACGLGNLAEIVPKVRLLAAERLAVPLDSVRVLMVAHHALEPAAFGEPMAEIPPYYVRVEHNEEDVTERVKAHQLLLAPYPLPPGPPTHFLTAGCAIRLTRALVSAQDTLLHVPAPNGLPGGYPVIANKAGVQPAPLEDLSLAEAIDLNERSHRFDGIERIEADGTAVFRPAAAQILRDELGYSCDRLQPAESEARATELMVRFEEYARRYGVQLGTGGPGPSSPQ
jgi:hypothetical protein